MNKKASTPIAIALLFLTTFIGCNQSNDKQEIEPPFCHHVFIWLHNPDNPADRAAFEKGIEGLSKIPEIKALHFGIPATTEVRGVVEASYTYSLAVFFDDEAGHDIYQDHPLHLKFVDDCNHLWSKVLVYDSVALKR